MKLQRALVLLLFLALTLVSCIIPLAQDAPPELLRAVFRQMADDAAMVARSCLIEVTPEKEFVTYGVGVPLMQMRNPEQARGRAPSTALDVERANRVPGRVRQRVEAASQRAATLHR